MKVVVFDKETGEQSPVIEIVGLQPRSIKNVSVWFDKLRGNPYRYELRQCGSFCAYDCYGCNRPEEEARYIKGLKTQLKTYQEPLPKPLPKIKKGKWESQNFGIRRFYDSNGQEFESYILSLIEEK